MGRQLGSGVLPYLSHRSPYTDISDTHLDLVKDGNSADDPLFSEGDVARVG